MPFFLNYYSDIKSALFRKPLYASKLLLIRLYPRGTSKTIFASVFLFLKRPILNPPTKYMVEGYIKKICTLTTSTRSVVVIRFWRLFMSYFHKKYLFVMNK